VPRTKARRPDVDARSTRYVVITGGVAPGAHAWFWKSLRVPSYTQPAICTSKSRLQIGYDTLVNHVNAGHLFGRPR
jgi:hypothetical protein